eukprot:COSAG01_NODE_50269_length_364_cov_2.996226_1_plen_45_part_10
MHHRENAKTTTKRFVAACQRQSIRNRLDPRTNERSPCARAFSAAA